MSSRSQDLLAYFLFYRSCLVEVVIVSYWHGLLRDESSRQFTLLDQIHITKVLQLMPIKTVGVTMKHNTIYCIYGTCTQAYKCQN